MSEEARGHLAEPAGSAAAGVLVVPDPGQAEALADAMDRPAARAALNEAVGTLRSRSGGGPVGVLGWSLGGMYALIQATTGYLPGLLAGLVALLALGTTAHALITSVRRRRRDLAILKTLGFRRSQISQTVACQATTFAVVAGLIGVPTRHRRRPLGVAAGGRAAGVAAGPVVPPIPVLAVVIGGPLVANLVAAGPGWTAARIRPSVALRSE